MRTRAPQPGGGFGVWVLGFCVLGMESGVQAVGLWGCGVWSFGFGVLGFGFWVLDLGFGVWGVGFGVWVFLFGVWCLGSRVEGLDPFAVAARNDKLVELLL